MTGGMLRMTGGMLRMTESILNLVFRISNWKVRCEGYEGAKGVKGGVATSRDTVRSFGCASGRLRRIAASSHKKGLLAMTFSILDAGGERKLKSKN